MATGIFGGAIACVGLCLAGANAVGATTVTDAPKFAATAPVNALCRTGSGDFAAYAEAVNQLTLAAKANAQLVADRPAFSTFWSMSQASGAKWDVCVEIKDVSASFDPPFKPQVVQAQDAAYASCNGSPSDAQSCIDAVISFIRAGGKTPSSLPRLKQDPSKPDSFEVWIPINK